MHHDRGLLSLAFAIRGSDNSPAVISPSCPKTEFSFEKKANCRLDELLSPQQKHEIFFPGC
jgi:hypothetical protein